MNQNSLLSYSNVETLNILPDPIFSKMTTSQKDCDLNSLLQTPNVKPYFMNSPVSNSTTQNCVDDNSFANDKLQSDADYAAIAKGCSSIKHFTLQADEQNNSLANINNNLTASKPRSSCVARQQPIIYQRNGQMILNADEDDVSQKRQKSISYACEEARGRAATMRIQDTNINNNGLEKNEESSDDDEYSFTDSDSSVSQQNAIAQNQQLQGYYPPYQNNWNEFNNLFYLSQESQYFDYQQFQQFQQYQTSFNGNYPQMQFPNNFFFTPNTNNINNNIIQENIDQPIDLQPTAQNQELTSQQDQGLLKKGISKDLKEKKKFKYGYKNMTREEYHQYRQQKAAKRDKKKLEKESAAGSIETEKIIKLVLVKIQEKPKKQYIPKQVRMQQELERQLNPQSVIAPQINNNANQCEVLQKVNPELESQIFQFSRNADKPLVRTVHKRELVIQFQVQTANPFALLEIGVFNYQDNIEFYFINKFKIINKFINKDYNQNKYFETELTNDDFVFKNGGRFEFAVKYNCIILKNLDTQTQTNLYCEKYIASNRKLNIFIRMFDSGDIIHLM